MPGRVLKESINDSPNLNACDDLAERHFYRLLVLADDFGCLQCTPDKIKGICYWLKPNIGAAQIDEWQKNLERHDLIYRWSFNSRQYCILPKLHLHQRIRSTHQRKTPEPPKAILDKCNKLLTHDSDPLANDSEVLTDDGLNPNPNPNPNPNNTPKGDSRKKRVTKKETDPRIAQIFGKIHEHYGYTGDNGHDPIPNYGKEGQSIKRMLTRGFTCEEILNCWKSKISQRGGDYVSMVYVNEDIGKKVVGRVSVPKRQCSTDEEIAESIKEATTWHGDK